MGNAKHSNLGLPGITGLNVSVCINAYQEVVYVR